MDIDYSNEFIQQYYLLRFYPAYLAEYYLMYSEILEEEKYDNSINILSIGSGCGLDYSAMKLAIRDNGYPNDIYYQGIDKYQWNYIESRDVKFRNICADIKNIDNLKEICKKDIDIIIFPKSIGEINGYSFNKLINLLVEYENYNEKLIILSSERQSFLNHDRNRLKQLNDRFIEYYDLENNLTIYYRTYNVRGINNLIKEFKYPDNIYQYLNNLHFQCLNYNKRKSHCKSPDDRLDRTRPILTAEHIVWDQTTLKLKEV